MNEIKLRLDEFLESKASDSEKEQAKKDYLESIELAEQEHGDVLIQQKAAFETKRERNSLHSLLLTYIDNKMCR